MLHVVQTGPQLREQYMYQYEIKKIKDNLNFLYDFFDSNICYKYTMNRSTWNTYYELFLCSHSSSYLRSLNYMFKPQNIVRFYLPQNIVRFYWLCPSRSDIDISFQGDHHFSKIESCNFWTEAYFSIYKFSK